ncbi:MAG: DUF932 domain-containing protein [Candidatus Electryonea clarkiae]|nr:DUF932 domain-containing protein [Candidatus Electryonea clarkiae]MDP8287036.1 DUF932 domain-containing protein [Candidatus Electryonea clarkiae]
MQNTFLPFAPVELQPLQTPDGNKSSRQSVVLDPEGERFEAGVVSNDYRLIPNADVVQVAEDILKQSQLEYNDHQTMFDGKRFRRRYVVNQLQGEVRVGDTVAVVMDARNSYDGSSTFGLEFNAMRLVCSNGLQISFMLGGFRFKHWGDRDFESEMLNASENLLKVQNRMQVVMPLLTEMTRKRIKRVDIQQFFQEAKLPITVQAKIFNSIEEDNRWMLYQAATDVLTKQESFSAENLNRRVSQYFLSRN